MVFKGNGNIVVTADNDQLMHLRTYTVIPSLPEPVNRLRELAYNLWWSWNRDAQELFRRLDPNLWDEVVGNPVQFLAHISQKRLDQGASDTAYLAEMNRVLDAFDAYHAREAWFNREHPDFKNKRLAYFSMEFGLHESLPIYSGGLGILAGDHLKSASDLGIPLVGVGLLYRQGYFQQRLTTDGWQLEEYPSLDFFQIPAMQVKKEDGQPLHVRCPIGARDVTARIWKVQVGRVPLYLLDTDLADNTQTDREITHRLYSGASDMRIRQEILLGIGGLRALEAVGRPPDVCHMNEGHAAFLAIERIRQCMEKDGLDFGEAREAVAPSHVFTTHTPVPAGIDQFEQALLQENLGPYLDSMGLSLGEFSAIGKKNAADPNELFSMAVLALRLAGFANGVSALHGHVSRELWHTVWPGAPRDEVPINSITNGIHTHTWISPEMSSLLDRYLGPGHVETPEDQDLWRRVDEIPDLELWRVHERRRVGLVAFARRRVKEQLRRRGAPPSEVKAADEFLTPEALTIGFARRFAPYKRGALIFRDSQRLLKILSEQDRPVQFIFAGKAHPRDDNGKKVIQEIMSHLHKPEFRRRMVFIENYDMTVARILVQGVDVWLNNPIKPREASGTSGMKVSPNGGINFSILDGWWPEAYDGENGWAIDEGRIYDDPEYRDHLEGEAIYELLEKEIVPLFYDRGADGLPREWIARMKASMRTVSPMFSTTRMLKEYANMLYVPAATRWQQLSKDGFTAAKSLSHWKRGLAHSWNNVRVEEVQANDAIELPVGARVSVKARVHLGEVKPEDVAVELYHGRVDAYGRLVEGHHEMMKCDEHLENGTYWFNGEIPCLRSGQHGYAVRVLPRHADLTHRFDTGLILWG
ncbi:MAG: alpha-glucan family phosphorylase [Phycisphaerales bacterium]|nr:alpha-glucan family phosphorylase [Phycisphaerales bacterium]